MKTKITVLLIAFSIGFATFSNAQNISTRLNDNWKFLRSDIGSAWEAVRPILKEGNPECQPGWQDVTLPHCFNAMDCVEPDANYYQ